MGADYDFARHVWAETDGVIPDEFFRRMFVAQAMLETGWGQKYPPESFNVAGIKPTDDQPRMVYEKSPLRIFESIADCARSWWWLIRKSSHYAKPRNEYDTDMKDLIAEFERQAHAVRMRFAESFLGVYCPSASKYFKTWNAIRYSLKNEIGERPAKNDLRN